MGDKRKTMHDQKACGYNYTVHDYKNTGAIGEIQMYNFGHSTCKYNMYWDSPDLDLRACGIHHQAAHENLPVSTQGAFLHKRLCLTIGGAGTRSLRSRVQLGATYMC